MGNWTPSIVPNDDQTVYLLVDDFGRHCRAWRETDIEKTDLETIIVDMLKGQYSNAVRIGFLERRKAGPQGSAAGMAFVTAEVRFGPIVLKNYGL